MARSGQSLRAIRSWDGSQARAFEELCYQLRDPTPPGAVLTKLGNPDAGYEWYVRSDSNGSEAGWQAKYAFDFETLRGLMEASLKTVVAKRPNCRRLTFCIPIDLPDARQPNERKSARQKYEDWKVSVRERVPGAERIRIDLWQEGDLLERLAEPANRGRAWFFWDGQEVFGTEWCQQRLAVTSKLAGERYTPELNIELPIAFSLEGLGRSALFVDRYHQRRGAFVREIKEFRRNRFSGLGVTSEIRELRRELESAVAKLPRDVIADRRFQRADISAALTFLPDHLSRAYPNHIDERTKQRRSELRRQLGGLRRRLDELVDFLASPASLAAERGALLLTGDAGQGKTHLFCDAGQRALDSGRPAAVLLAQRFSGTRIFTEIAENLGLEAKGASDLLGAMAAAGEASGKPFVLLIDALNDSADPSGWRNELPALLAEADLYSPWVSIGVSVRTTYRNAIGGSAMDSLPSAVHPGFAGFEQDAAQRYFAWHGLEQPRVPLMLPEFSNPLFLSIYCQALAQGKIPPPEHGRVHVSRVFETYLSAKNERIAHTLRLDPQADLVPAAIEAFASAIPSGNREWLPYDHGKALVDAHAPHLHAWPDTLFGQLLAEGVLSEDLAYQYADDGSWDQVRSVQITFQRLADFRIAISLLSSCQTATDLRAQLKAQQPLREAVLAASAGVIEALAVLVPERFGVELLRAARWQLADYERHDWSVATLESVSTRSQGAVTGATVELLSQISGESSMLFEKALDQLVVLAAQPGHPLNGEFLHGWLNGLSMPERDASWGIATYTWMGESSSTSFDRLVRWAGAGPYADYDEEVIELACLPLCWALSSPNRPMRDMVTKALRRLLAPRLNLMLKLIERFAGVNDPYILERIAVIAQGAVLTGGHADPGTAVACGRRLADLVLDPQAVPHIIVRDAARGTMEWCLRTGLVEHDEYEAVTPPYRSTPPSRPRTPKQLEKIYNKRDLDGSNPYGSVYYSVFSYGDFGRYVIESDVRHFGPYSRERPRPRPRKGRKPKPDLEAATKILNTLDPEHREAWLAGDLDRAIEPLSQQQQFALAKALDPPRRVPRRTYDAELAQRWIFERVLSLGWTPDRFEGFDRSYHVREGQAGRSGHKPERFGKKYQWIALHELLARLGDNFHPADAYGDGPREYVGPWQFYGRHLDPTLPPAQRMIDDDGVERLGPTFSPNDDRAWWIPEGPNYSGELPPATAGWAERNDGIPSMRSLMLRSDDAGIEWVVLHAYYNWEERAAHDQDEYERARRGLWSHIYGWIVHREQAVGLYNKLSAHSLMGRWMPEGGDVTDAAYLAEMPWAAAVGDYPRSWEPVRFPLADTVSPVEVLPAWIGYVWEGNVWDCSIEDSVSLSIPAPTLFEVGHLQWLPGTTTWRDRSGSTAAQHVKSSGDRRSALLVRADWLDDVLAELDCSLVVGWLGEKQLRAAGIMGGLDGGWSEISGVARRHDGRWTIGKRRISVRQQPE